MLSKDQWLQASNAYAVSIISALVFSIVLCSPECDGLRAVLGMSFMFVWVYLVHRFLHLLPRTGPLRYLNWHWIFHHEPLPGISRGVSLGIEAINDLGVNLSVLLIQLFTGWYAVPFSVVLLHTIWYTSVHIVNYSLIGSPVHKHHHTQDDVNFGPDVMDHIYGTNQSTHHEDLLPMCVNLMVAFLIVYALKKTVHWVD